MFPSYRNQSVDLLCKSNQLTGFYMMGALVVKGLMENFIFGAVTVLTNPKNKIMTPSKPKKL